jgi:hypothetical protein
VKIDTITFDTTGTPVARLSLYYAQLGANPGSGTVSVTFPATVHGCNFHIDQVTGQNTSTPVRTANTNKAAANAVNFISANLAPLLSALNATYATASRDGNAPIDTWAGATELTDAGHTAPTHRLNTAYKINDTTASASQGSGTADYAIIAVEIMEASVSEGPTVAQFMPATQQLSCSGGMIGRTYG